jgi:hypothetical protein
MDAFAHRRNQAGAFRGRVSIGTHGHSKRTRVPIQPDWS